MPDLEQNLAARLAELADLAPHDPLLAARVRTRGRRRRLVTLGAVAASLVIVAGSAIAWERGRGAPVTTTTEACTRALTTRELPAWATTGFTSPHPVETYATSRSGNIVAILFGPQLSAPPDAEVGNKVLWVSRRSLATTPRIHATLEGSDTGDGGGITADVILSDGFGPSYVDMPRPGCWRLDLTWDGGHDTIRLPYYPPVHAQTPSRTP